LFALFLSAVIRSVPADASDSVYCMTLAQNAVHAAMSGFTGVTSGLVNNRTVLLPIPVITATSPSYLSPVGRTWERVISLTHQPSARWFEMAEEKREAAAKAGQAAAVAKAH
jgi:6-phosphofructokinase 1